MEIARSRTKIVALLGLLVAGVCAAGDVLRPQNTTTKDLGAIVDGIRGTVAVNDEAYLPLSSGGLFSAMFPIIPLANFTGSSQAEVIGFAHRRPPLLVDDVVWTEGSNSIDLVFDDEYWIDVHVWIVDPSPNLPAAVADAGVTVSQIWATERQGIAFQSFQIVDASGDPDAPGLLDFNCSLAVSMKALIGFVPGAVNVYYVDTVEFLGSGPKTTNGVWCGADLIGMGRLTSGHLLAHELGHAFNLKHTNEQGTEDLFGTSNVMYNASINRKYLTEGQTFRAVYHSLSAINGTYDVRAGRPTRDCAHHYSEANAPCPGVQKRIWADGPLWPPN